MQINYNPPVYRIPFLVSNSRADYHQRWSMLCKPFIFTTEKYLKISLYLYMKNGGRPGLYNAPDYNSKRKKPWMTYYVHSFIIGLALFTTFFLIISSSNMISIIVLKFWQHYANIYIAISFSQTAKEIGGGLPNSASCRWIAKQLRFLGNFAK